eukprot:jgi/Tetstr1/465207/TSEL_009913.t1
MSYETLKRLRHLARASGWFVSMDLADGSYDALGIREEDRDFTPIRRFLRNTRWRGERLLPYMDDFLFLADSREAALELRLRLDTPLDHFGLLRNPNKGV